MNQDIIEMKNILAEMEKTLKTIEQKLDTAYIESTVLDFSPEIVPPTQGCIPCRK